MALRLIDEGARLIADDQVVLRAGNGCLTATAPEPLAGLLEVRGVGILPVPCAPSAELGLVVDLVPPDRVERLPDADRDRLLGVALPRLTLAPFEASAPAKLRLAAAAARAGTLGRVPDRLAAVP